MQAKLPRPARTWRTYLLRGVLVVVGALGLFVAVVLVDGWTAFGRRAEGARLERMRRSPQWKEGQFENPQPIINDFGGMFEGLLEVSPVASPSRAPAVHVIDPAALRVPPSTGLRVTWLGHSTMLIEIDGHRVLTDPNWSDRASPLSWIGPKRWYPPPIQIGQLPRIDAVLISHDHYDHLDYPTITVMKAWSNVFIVPLGIGAHLEYWGIPAARIVELDWWESTRVRGLEIVCTPTRHASGRMLTQNGTLWSSFALIGAEHRAYFSGDTGLFPAMKEIGERLGPFDVTMIEVGQYHASWPDWHIGPEQAVTAHGWLRGKAFFPMHWGLLTLAYHGWTEPIERVLVAAEEKNVSVLASRPGQQVEPGAPLPLERWWPEVAWETAEESPIVSSQVH